MGPNLAWIFKNYWKRQRIVAKAGKCLGIAFETERGVTEDDPTSPISLIIVVDVVVQEVCDVVCIPKKAQHGMEWAAGNRNPVLYADDGRIEGQDHDWVQDEFTVTVAMFLRMGLDSNLDKTNTVVCTPRFIWGEWGWVLKSWKTTMLSLR